MKIDIAHYYHYDALGAVVALSNNSGNIVETYSYDVFGQPSGTGSVGNPYFFTGRRYDDETGLYYYRARYYNAEIGRFLQTDPIGYWAGLNLYTYCGNNPLNWADPYGWCKGEPWYKQGWNWWELTVRSKYDEYKPDPGFRERFTTDFYRNRWPGAKYFSALPIPLARPVGPAGALVSHYGAQGLARIASREATRKFTSFSASRNWAYVHGVRPGYAKAARVVRGVGWGLWAATAAYTGSDIGTGIYAVGAAWRE